MPSLVDTAVKPNRACPHDSDSTPGQYAVTLIQLRDSERRVIAHHLDEVRLD